MMGLREYFDVRKIGGGEMTKSRVWEMIADGCRHNAEEDLIEQIGTKLNSLAIAFEKSTGGGRWEIPRNVQPQQQEEMYVASPYEYSRPSNQTPK
jgi:hypothetical protein